MSIFVSTKVRCPKCKSADLLLTESGTWTSEFKVTDGRFDRQDGIHNPVSVDRLEARCCRCPHQWKVRGAQQIDDAVSAPSARPMSGETKPDPATDLSLWCYMHPKEAAALIRKAREVIRPFAGDKMPPLKKTERAFNRDGLRCLMSPMEIACTAASAFLEEK